MRDGLRQTTIKNNNDDWNHSVIHLYINSFEQLINKSEAIDTYIQHAQRISNAGKFPNHIRIISN